MPNIRKLNRDPSIVYSVNVMNVENVSIKVKLTEKRYQGK